MLTFVFESPGEVARMLAGRVKTLRLDREWTQEELAARAGVTLSTYKRFERTGRISLDRLLKLAVVLDAREGFEQLFVRPQARSLAELERIKERSERKRGKRSDAKA